MPRWVIAGLCAGLSTACVPVDRDAARDVIGVSAARPASGKDAPDAATQALLDWKSRQICTNGYAMVGQDIEVAEDDQQLVDWQLRCRLYTHVSLF
jgi:hypothetical protein